MEENEIIEEEQVSIAKRPERHHRKPDSGKKPIFYIRQILNALFIIIGIIGAYMYYKGNDAGIVVFIIAMAFKMAESALRLLK